MCVGGTPDGVLYDSPRYFWTWAPNIFCAIFDILDPAANKISYPWLWDYSVPCFHLQ